MEKLVEQIVSSLEILILGVMAAGTLGYFFALFKPARRLLVDYLNYLSVNLLEKTFKDFYQWIKVGLALGIIYYAGLLANGAAYWVMSPVHNEIIENINSKDGKILRFRHLGLLPLYSNDVHIDAYRDYLNREVAWQNRNLEAAKHALDPLIRVIRGCRGAVFFALVLMLIAVIKLGLALVFMIFDMVAIRYGEGHVYFIRVLAFVYRLFIDDNYHFLNKARAQDNSNPPKTNPTTVDPSVLYLPAYPEETVQPKTNPTTVDPSVLRRADFKKMGNIVWTKALLPNFIILALSFLMYFFSMGSWYTVETEYHLIVREGEKTAPREAKQTEYHLIVREGEKTASREAKQDAGPYRPDQKKRDAQ
jgi:hypothetical protein